MVNKEVEGVWSFLPCHLTPWRLKLTVLSDETLTAGLRQDLFSMRAA